jgi:hypothetical protein
MFQKMLGLAALSSLFLFACKKSDRVADESISDLINIAPETRTCASFELLQQQLKDDPAMQQRMDEIEAFTDRYLQGSGMNTLQSDGSLLVPVIVNVLYRTTAENISIEQINSQIAVLNEDFGATNSDYNLTSTYNSVKSGDTRIKFVLENVNRKLTNKTSWTTNNAMKKTSQGGLDPTNPTSKLNIWVCNMGGGILGYAQFPGGASSTDGVVIDNNAFGRVGTVTAPYNKGRTATHEVGHWFNLRHIWGDASCGSDNVNDTPLHNASNYGCPAAGHASTCTGTPVEMTMNYMDYTDDRCMYMFTALQKSRMQATYAVGGPRAALR